MAFELYETPNTNARYILDPDMRLLGKVTLSLPSGWAGKVKGTDYPLKVRRHGVCAGSSRQGGTRGTVAVLPNTYMVS